MKYRISASVRGDVKDLGFAGGTVLGVLDAVGFGWKVRSKLGGADDYLEVGGLVQTFGFAGVKAGDYGLNGNSNVRSADRSSGRVVCAWCVRLDVCNGLAPVVEDGGRDWGKYVVNATHINLGRDGRRSLRRHPCSKGLGRTAARGTRRRRC